MIGVFKIHPVPGVTEFGTEGFIIGNTCVNVGVNYVKMFAHLEVVTLFWNSTTTGSYIDVARKCARIMRKSIYFVSCGYEGVKFDVLIFVEDAETIFR